MEIKSEILVTFTLLIIMQIMGDFFIYNTLIIINMGIQMGI